MRALLFLAPLLVGCTIHFTYTKLNDPPHRVAPKVADDIEVFQAQPPGREYVEIGLIEAEKPVFDRDAEISPSTVQKFRVQAAKLGCEFIVLGSKTPVNAKPVRADRYRAACVVYR